MENFIVSARKYRPVTFDSVVGQAHVTNTLKNAIRNNHLAQAFLFCGPRGVGKTTCARILAKTINCQNLSENTEPCNTCESCTSFNESASFSIYELDAASNNSVDDIRALVEQVRYAPQGARYKIYIIDEVHMLSASAFNAFLKTLEEPPSYAIFILATTERHKILPTILSRCQIFDFKRIKVSDITSHLQSICTKEGVTAEHEALHIIAQKADGALRDALSIFDQMVSFSGNTLTYADVIRNLNMLDYDYYFRVTDAFLGRDTTAVLLLFDEVLSKGFDAQLFLNGLSEHMRNLLICKDESTLKLLEVAETTAGKYQAQAKACSTSFLLNALSIANQFDVNLKASRNQRLHVELALLKMCHILSILELGEAGDKKKTEPLKKEADKPSTSAPLEEPSKPLNLTRLSGLKNISKPEEPRPQAPETDTPPVNAAPPPVLAGERQAVSQTQVDDAWLRYAQAQLDKGRKQLHVMLKTYVPRIEGETLLLKLGSKVEIDLIEEIKLELLQTLKTWLSNVYLQLEVILEKTEEGRREPYTNKEKFKALADENPAVMELRNLLELDFE